MYSKQRLYLVEEDLYLFLLQLFNLKILKSDKFIQKLNEEFPVENWATYASFIKTFIWLNEEVLGEWVSALFHKNDGYRTPLVINPYRKSGNIDVNSEIHLAQTRLLTYISLTNNKEILKDKEVESIKFTLSAKNFQEKKVSQFENYDIFNEIYNGIYGENSVLIEKAEISKVPNFDVLMNYIKGKINKITKVYEDYHGFELFENETISQRTIEKLKKDKSHVTLKLRQTLNIINFNLLEIELYFHPEYQRRFVFELLEHLNKLGDEKKISNIKGINMLFCTHSPFILSDIPKQNVLFLDERKDDKSTFASNISTMLSESFFMNDLIGEFAKQKINETLKWEGNDKVETFKFIELIDEPILRYKLY